MRNRSQRHRGLAFGRGALLAITLATGCATPPQPPPPAPVPDLVWPAPPDPPRIRYVQSIRVPADVGMRRNAAVRFFRWVTGADEEDRLAKPFGIAVDEVGNLCLTDTATASVSVIDTAKKTWHRWDRAGSVPLISPVAIAKRRETVFVADSALGAVIVFSDRGKLIQQLTNHLERPVAIALAGESLLVADSARHCIVEFDQDGRYVSEFGRRGDQPGDLNFPTHLATDGEGQIYVTDSMNGRIQIFDRNHQYRTTIGQTGDCVGCFSRPKGVAVDSFGHIYIVDGNFDNIQIFNQEARILLPFGSTGEQPGQFWLPNGIAISENNDIYIADCYNRRVQVFTYVGVP